MKVVTVHFLYNEMHRKWDTVVHGVTSELEAKQAFAAVVITCQNLDERLLGRELVQATDPESYRIIPAV
jgi:hypothetical protein